jgi:putative transposase
MAEGQMMTAADVVAGAMAGEHGDLLRDAVALVVRELMEAEVAQLTGAGRGERSAERVTHLNGYRPRLWATRVGELELAIPRTRSGPAYFPSFLEPRRRCEQAIVAVVMEAYVNGVSTRKVDRLVEQLGIQGMDKDRVSRLCRELDEHVEQFRTRPLEGAYPYLWLDAKHVRVRDRGRVLSKALVIAYGVHESGRREVIGIDLGHIEREAFWTEFLRGLRSRGLVGLRLVVSDHHEGLRPPSPGFWTRPGSAAACTSCATCTATAARRSAAWCPPRCARSSTPRPRGGPPPRRRAHRPPRLPGPQGLRAARGRRGRPAGVHGLPRRALEQAALHEPA